MDKNKESSDDKYWDLNNLYGWAVSQKLLVSGFKLAQALSKFDKGFKKSDNKKSKKRYFLQVNVLKNYTSPIMIHHFHQEERIFKKSKNLLLIYMMKMNMLFT